MKKFLALLLALIMVVSLAACSGDPAPTTEPTSNNNPTTQPTQGNDPTTEPTQGSEGEEGSEGSEGTEPAGLVDSYNVTYNPVDAGSVEMNLNTAVGGGEVNYDAYQGIAGKDYTDPEQYTLYESLASTSGMNWDPLNWETNDDSYVLTYLSSGLLEFTMGATLDTWAISTEMAAALPEDVTAEYVGQYGIKEGETGKAWKFTLNPDACWQDGTPINADTYIYSAQQQLDPKMLNRRADSLYAGDAAIYNAKNYVYQGREVTSALIDDGITLDALVLGEDGVYTTANGEIVYVAVDTAEGFSYLGGNTLKQYVDAYGDAYFDITNWDALVALMDETGKAPLTEDTLAYLTTTITGNPAWGEDESYLTNYITYTMAYAAMDFSEVGYFKTGEYEIVMVTKLPIENANYYVPYNLGGTALVYQPLWESCKSYYDADGNTVAADSDAVASVKTNYGTSVETTMSYGPYKLTYFEMDKQITFERNENWYGYKDGKHVGQYQTDTIKCAIIAEHDTELLTFLNGQLSYVGMDSEDMETYGTSEHIRYTPQSYTTKLSFNTNFDSLYSRGTGSQILVNQNFRKAFSLALDRTTFATSYTAASEAGYGMLNYMYIYDPTAGATYRGSEGGMQALVDVYGLTYGEDGDYETLEEAHDAITGYDLNAAKALMAQAYDECVQEGLYDGTSEISLQINVYSSEDIYVQMVNYFNDCLAAATAGTGFEGKIKLSLVVDADYYETMYSGGTDIIFTTWGGAAYNPYSMLYQCYCDAADGSGNQMEYGFDTSKIMVTININGVDYTADLQAWSEWACSMDTVIYSADGTQALESFLSYDGESRAAVYGRLEYAYMSFFATTPLYYRFSAVLYSQQISMAAPEYCDLVGYGGIQFLTYNYTDAEWANVAGTLTY